MACAPQQNPIFGCKDEARRIYQHLKLIFTLSIAIFCNEQMSQGHFIQHLERVTSFLPTRIRKKLQKKNNRKSLFLRSVIAIPDFYGDSKFCEIISVVVWSRNETEDV